MSEGPAYASRATMARLLDCAPSTVDELVKRGILPQPIHLSSGCVRWCWADVQGAIASLQQGGTSVRDPYLVGVQNAAKGN